MRKPAAVLICVLLAAVTAVAVDARPGRTVTATWVGTVGFAGTPLGTTRRANARLEVSATTIEASFEGYTGASHDSLSARTSCSIRYRLVKRQGAWSLYHQVGVSRYAAIQYVQNAPCESRDYGAVKTALAGGKLRADFGSFDRYTLFEPAPLWRAYLHRG